MRTVLLPQAAFMFLIWLKRTSIFFFLNFPQALECPRFPRNNSGQVNIY